MCLLALAELLWSSRHLIQAFTIGHVGATLIVAAGLAAAVAFDWVPRSIAGASDVGLSYGAVALILGMLLSTRFRVGPHWTAVRWTLLGIGVAFGLLLLVGVSPSAAPVALSAGLAAASTTAWLVRGSAPTGLPRRQRCPDPSTCPDRVAAARD